ncbi:helix-turn-helix transcriptional regulator [Streptomyces tanashiensis]|uniref:helix-turn-helix transcriptional regulator n=1 Tax=Streptomyces tanashiensis TaxID=67367 RepID=UPI0036E5EB18
MTDPVAALLRTPTRLPTPALRASLRLAHNLTQQDVADALGVHRVQVNRWEMGKSEPRNPHRRDYIRLLEELAELHPEVLESETGMPTPTSKGGSG